MQKENHSLVHFPKTTVNIPKEPLPRSYNLAEPFKYPYPNAVPSKEKTSERNREKEAKESVKGKEIS
jgi:hypothetical protein